MVAATRRGAWSSIFFWPSTSAFPSTGQFEPLCKTKGLQCVVGDMLPERSFLTLTLIYSCMNGESYIFIHVHVYLNDVIETIEEIFGVFNQNYNDPFSD